MPNQKMSRNLLYRIAESRTLARLPTVRGIVQRLTQTTKVFIHRDSGFWIQCDPFELGDRVIINEFVTENAYDLNLVNFVPDQVFDFGAHIGLFSLHAIGKFPDAKLIAFEPSVRNFELLTRNFQINRKKGELRNSAIACSDGVASFSTFSSCDGRLSHPSSSDSQATPISVKVRTEGIANILSKSSARNALIKLDIEGGEAEVLPAMAPFLPQECAIFFETHFTRRNWESAVALLESIGFSVSELRQNENCVDGFAIRNHK